MNTLQKKVYILLITSALILAGVFCAGGMAIEQSDCMNQTGVVWCSDFLSHGTIMSHALLGVIAFFTALFVVAFVRVWNFQHIQKYVQLLQVRLRHYYSYSARGYLPVRPLTLAFAKGVIHPRIP